jgi:hypothetical protein
VTGAAQLADLGGFHPPEFGEAVDCEDGGVGEGRLRWMCPGHLPGNDGLDLRSHMIVLAA